MPLQSLGWCVALAVVPIPSTTKVPYVQMQGLRRAVSNSRLDTYSLAVIRWGRGDSQRYPGCQADDPSLSSQDGRAMALSVMLGWLSMITCRWPVAYKRLVGFQAG